MTGSMLKTPFVLIPIVLDALVLLMVPSLLRQWGAERTALITAAAMGAPWLLYFVIGRILEYAMRTGAAEREEAEKRDFV